MVAHPDRNEQIDLAALKGAAEAGFSSLRCREVLALVEAVEETRASSEHHGFCVICGMDEGYGHTQTCPIARFRFAVPAETKEQDG